MTSSKPEDRTAKSVQGSTKEDVLIIDLSSSPDTQEGRWSERRQQCLSSSQDSDAVIITQTILGSSSLKSGSSSDEVIFMSESGALKSSPPRKRKSKEKDFVPTVVAQPGEVVITKEFKPPWSRIGAPDIEIVSSSAPTNIDNKLSTTSDDVDDSELPVCSFLPSRKKYKKLRMGENSLVITPFDLLGSFPVVKEWRSREEKYNVDGTPLYWTVCETCSERCTDRYHVLEVPNGMEFDQIVSAMTPTFTVLTVHRVQNGILWKRFKGEKSLMREGAHGSYNLHETWLYHTSTAQVDVICEEGLDPRLARTGNFGRGTYFSDAPTKCHSYAVNHCRGMYTMFLCRVLLGDIKEYPRGQSDNQLTREPPKPKPRPGEKKMYDSVKGNLSGGDEYVVYNPYRVLPEYVIEYNITATPCHSQPNCLVPAFQPVGITQTLALGMALSKSRLKTPSGGKTKSGKKTPSGGKKKKNSKTKAPFRSGGSCSGKHSIPPFPPASNPSLPGGSNYNPPMNSVTGGVGSSVQPTAGVIFPSPSVQTSNTQTGMSSATSFLSHPASQVLPPPLPAVPAVPNVPPVCLSRSQLVALYSNIKKAVLQSMDNQSQ